MTAPQPKAKATRTPLTADYVGKVNAAAMKALGDTEMRCKWAYSKYSSPVVTSLLCAEIARLNIALDALLEQARLFEKSIEYEIKRSDDDEGVRPNGSACALPRRRRSPQCR